MSKNLLIMGVSIFLLSMVITAMVYKSWTLGSDSDHWVPICVKGQLVYRANFGYKGMAVNALSENGNPVSCKPVQS